MYTCANAYDEVSDLLFNAVALCGQVDRLAGKIYLVNKNSLFRGQ